MSQESRPGQGGGKAPKWEYQSITEIREIAVHIDKRKGPVGLKMTGADFIVEAIDPLGLIHHWNKYHQPDAIVPGDSIIAVGGIEREQEGGPAMAAALREATGPVTLVARRPYTRMEFGWYMNLVKHRGLGAAVDEDALKIVALFESGTLADWNEDSPLLQLQPGDLILEVNGKMTKKHGIQKSFSEVQPGAGFTMRVRRPGHFTYVAVLEKKDTAPKVGIRFSKDDLKVERVEAGGLADQWNRSHGGYPISPGDRLVEVAGAHVAQVGGDGITRIIKNVATTMQFRFVFGEAPAPWPSVLNPPESEEEPAPAPAARVKLTGGAAQVGIPRSREVRRFSFRAKLKASHGADAGVDLDLSTCQVKAIRSRGRVAGWNSDVRICPIKAGDKITDAGYKTVADYGALVLVETIERGDDIEIRLVRDSAITFPVWLDRTGGVSKLGVGIDQATLAITRIDQGGLVSQWNMENPDLIVRIGDRLWEVHGQNVLILGVPAFLKALQSPAPMLELRLLREEPDVAEVRANSVLAQPPPSEQLACATVANHAGNSWGPFRAVDDLDLDVSALDFYRRIWAPYGPETGPDVPLVQMGSNVTPDSKVRRDHYACPCCHRLFHVYIAEGRYQTIVAQGPEGDTAVQFALQSDWNLLRQRHGNR